MMTFILIVGTYLFLGMVCWLIADTMWGPVPLHLIFTWLPIGVLGQSGIGFVKDNLPADWVKK